MPRVLLKIHPVWFEGGIVGEFNLRDRGLRQQHDPFVIGVSKTPIPIRNGKSRDGS